MSVIKRFLEMYQQGIYHPPKRKGQNNVTKEKETSKQESQPVIKNEKEKIKQLNFNF